MNLQDNLLSSLNNSDVLNISKENDPFLYVEQWVPHAVDNIPEDLASEHDHYLYNLPKKNYHLS